MRFSQQLNKSIRFSVLSVLLTAVSFSGYAGVRPENTREIVKLSPKEHQVDVANSSLSPYMVQVWVETLEGQRKDIPVVVTPPIFRINGKAKGGVKVLPVVDLLPDDRESVYMLVIQEIPLKADKGENTLRIAVRTKIKLIIRPEQLNRDDIGDSFSKIVWKLNKVNNQFILTANNPTPFNFAITDFSYRKGGNLNDLTNEFVNIQPFSEYRLVLKREMLENNTLIFSYAYINDFGGISKSVTKRIGLEGINQ